MEREGFEQVFQLDGGILKYFEECGGQHYAGDCFVFDQRVGVDPSLAESDNTQCFKCLKPLTLADQQDPRYVPEVSCPYCYLTDAQRMARTIADREAAIALATTPLPGSEPYDNYRPIKISTKFDRQTLIDTLCGIFLRICRLRALAGAVSRSSLFWMVVISRSCRSSRSAPGERYLDRMPATCRTQCQCGDSRVVRRRGHNRRQQAGTAAAASIRPIQSQHAAIDLESGLSPSAASSSASLGRQHDRRGRHRTNAVFRKSIADAVCGGRRGEGLSCTYTRPSAARRIQCDAPIGSCARLISADAIDEHGQVAACTKFRVLRRLADGTASLVEARPITGRTNQIRVHLWHLGWPVVSDRAYIANQQLGDTPDPRKLRRALCFCMPIASRSITR